MSPGGSEALHAWTDGYHDHVLLQSLIVAESGVTARCQKIYEAIFDDDLELDLGMGL